MTFQRTITADFLNDLEEGILKPLLEKFKRDDTLMLALRNSYINVYYRGGSILKLKDLGGRYGTHMDPNYFKAAPAPSFPPVLATQDDTAGWVAALPQLKSFIDDHLAIKHATEREFQQLAAWENNRSPVSNESEYFITDIEFADRELGARFDMLGVRWLGHQRQSGNSLVPVLIEMKYGNGALSGNSGIVCHYHHIAEFLGDDKKRQAIRETIQDQFINLRDLGMIKYNESSLAPNPSLSDAKPEVIFLLANYNPRSPALIEILSKLHDMDRENDDFDLRFFVSAFAGYAMHHACMLTAGELLQVMERFPRK